MENTFRSISHRCQQTGRKRLSNNQPGNRPLVLKRLAEMLGEFLYGQLALIRIRLLLFFACEDRTGAMKLSHKSADDRRPKASE